MSAYLPPGTLAAADRAINHVIAYGQSLSSGWEGAPALSTKSHHDNLMLGSSVRPVHEQASVWTPQGSAIFQPLIATNESLDGHHLSLETVASLPPDQIVLGETVLQAALFEWRARLRTMVPPRRLLASSAGVGGRSLEALSKGADPELFNRLRDCARLARDLAQGDYAIAALIMLQGENNAWALGGATAGTQAYKALFSRFLDDFDTDITSGIARQSAKPAVFTHQTGGAYSSEDLSIAQAQFEIARENRRVFLVGPVYPVTDKGGHLDANGYRWLGAQFGRIMHKVLTLGEDWQPLHPRAALLHESTIRIDFHVPAPPLAWGAAHLGHTRHLWDDRGFTALDHEGRIDITQVELRPTQVILHLARPAGPGCTIRYADAFHHGTGNLHDSETATAQDHYEYAPGHWPSANIPELVGKPYPLMNWCIAFRIGLGR